MITFFLLSDSGKRGSNHGVGGSQQSGKYKLSGTDRKSVQCHLRTTEFAWCCSPTRRRQSADTTGKRLNYNYSDASNESIFTIYSCFGYLNCRYFILIFPGSGRYGERKETSGSGVGKDWDNNQSRSGFSRTKKLRSSATTSGSAAS